MCVSKRHSKIVKIFIENLVRQKWCRMGKDVSRLEWKMHHSFPNQTQFIWERDYSNDLFFHHYLYIMHRKFIAVQRAYTVHANWIELLNEIERQKSCWFTHFIADVKFIVADCFSLTFFSPFPSLSPHCHSIVIVFYDTNNTGDNFYCVVYYNIVPYSLCDCFVSSTMNVLCN